MVWTQMWYNSLTHTAAAQEKNTEIQIRIILHTEWKSVQYAQGNRYYLV